MKTTACLLCVLTLSGCGHSGGTPPVRAAGTIEGTVMLGPVSGAVVTAFPGDGGAALAATTTDSNGHYQLAVSAASQTLLLVASGGHYVEEASGSGVDLGAGDVLYAYVPYQSGQGASAAITPFTHIAAGLTRYWVAQGQPLDTAAATATAAMSLQLGFDVTQTQPLDVADPLNADTQMTPGLSYGFVLAAVSAWTLEAGAQALVSSPNEVPYDSMDWTQQLYNDIRQDGTLDGSGTAGAVHLGSTALTPVDDCHGVAVALVQVAALRGDGGTGGYYGNETGLPVSLVLPEAATFNANLAGLCAGTEPPLIEGGLLIHPDPVTPPAPLGWVGGQAQFTGTLDDAFGLAGNQVTVSVDGSAPVAVPVAAQGRGVYAYQWPLDTTAYGPDGRHSIVVSATDLAGYTGVAAVPLGFDNTPPTGCVSVYAPLSAGSVFAGEWRDGTGSGVVQVSLNGVPGTVASGTWQVPEAPVLATVPGLNLLYHVIPVYLSLTDAAGNTTTFDIFPEPQWSQGQNPVSCYVF